VASAANSRTPVAAVKAKPAHMSQKSLSRDARGMPDAKPRSRRSIAELSPTSVLNPKVWRKRMRGYP
jgi:hypothetical protein